MRESELVDNIVRYLNKYNIRNVQEVRMGIGVPDIVINIRASKAIEQISDYYLLLIIEYISQNKKVTISNIADYFSFDTHKCQSYLYKLTEKNIIYLSDSKLKINKKIFGINLGKTISIEAKIKDWRGGLLQAQRYLMFSDYSYLALPKDKIRNVDLNLLKTHNIGLLSITLNSIEEILPPAKSLECDYKLKYLATSAILEKNKSPNKRRPDSIFSQLT